jgi:hypothetical protein
VIETEAGRRFGSKLERGQSLVETALGMMFVFIFFLGMLDLARVYFISVALEDSASDAALFLSLFPDCAKDTDGACSGKFNAEYRARNAASGDLNWENVIYDADVPAPWGVGDRVSVELVYQLDLLMPVVSQIASTGGLTLTAKATQTIVAED